MRSALHLAGKTFSRWSRHHGPRLGAALAFYTLLSAAPLAVFAVVIGSSVLGRQAAEGSLSSFATEWLGPRGASLLQSVMIHVREPRHFDVAAAIAIGALIYGASSAFLELRDDLNTMWEAHPKERGLAGILLRRIFSFVLVLAAGVVLLASMLAAAAVSVITRFFRTVLPVPPWVLETGNFVASVIVLSAVFLLIYRFVPDLYLPWNALWEGALVSALLFAVGRALLSLYLNKVGVGSAYGAAGSIVAAALFVYYAAQIFLLGAELTYVLAHRTAQREREAFA